MSRDRFWLAAAAILMLWCQGLVGPVRGEGPGVPAPFRVAGYLPEYRFAKFDPQHASALTDLILFAGEPSASGEIDMSRLKNTPWPLLKEFKTRQRLRLWLCIGGWGRSANFAQVVQDEAARRQLVRSAVEMLLAQRLDGLDIDWEHPENQAQQQGYAELLRSLKEAFQPHGLLLTLTMAPWQQLPAEAYQASDWVQLMSYDYGQRHSTFEQAEKDVNSFLERGIPPEKIVLGIPFYGRHVVERDKSITYAEVLRQFAPEPGTDEASQFFFNGPETIRKKTRLAVEAGLGGVMIWEIGQDATDERSLLKVISEEITAPRRPSNR